VVLRGRSEEWKAMSDELERAVEEAVVMIARHPTNVSTPRDILRNIIIQQRRRGWTECARWVRIQNYDGQILYIPMLNERDRRYPEANAEPPIGEHEEETP
jgi:Glu-tRNA(Gln) amidotransferase subunit E-like FAD-binding protein